MRTTLFYIHCYMPTAILRGILFLFLLCFQLLFFNINFPFVLFLTYPIIKKKEQYRKKEIENMKKRGEGTKREDYKDREGKKRKREE